MSDVGMVFAIWFAGSGVTLFGLMAWEPAGDIMDNVARAVVSLFWPVLVAVGLLIVPVGMLIVPVAIIAYSGGRFGRWMRRRRQPRAEAAP